jgi:hypothetical protein
LLQLLPAQQGCPVPPQTPQVPRPAPLQPSPALQARPSQQAWLAAPHWVQTPAAPPLQKVLGAVHSPPAQHWLPAPPQFAPMFWQAPAVQVPPEGQAWPAAMQRSK